jgi:hypothetical protein
MSTSSPGQLPSRGSGAPVGRALTALAYGLARSIVTREDERTLPFDDGFAGGLRAYGARAWLALRWTLGALASGLCYFGVRGVGPLLGATDSLAPAAVSIALVVLVGVVNPDLLLKVASHLLRAFIALVLVTSVVWLLWVWLRSR